MRIDEGDDLFLEDEREDRYDRHQNQFPHYVLAPNLIQSISTRRSLDVRRSEHDQFPNRDCCEIEREGAEEECEEECRKREFESAGEEIED